MKLGWRRSRSKVSEEREGGSTRKASLFRQWTSASHERNGERARSSEPEEGTPQANNEKLDWRLALRLGACGSESPWSYSTEHGVAAQSKATHARDGVVSMSVVGRGGGGERGDDGEAPDDGGGWAMLLGGAGDGMRG